MAQETLSLQSSKVLHAAGLTMRSGGLKWKIAATFSALIVTLGVLVSGIVYHLMGNALQRQVDLRATAIATNLSDAAAGFVARKSALEVDALIAKYGRLDGVAYAFILGPKDNLIASSLQPFPAELRDSAASNNRRAIVSRVTKLRGNSIYETQVPLLDGQLGTVHVGLSADSVRQDIHGAVLYVIGLIALCLVAGIVASVFLAAKTTRPILELKGIADEISRGDLDRSVAIESDDEVGELARSVERMRASLKAAMVRLNRAE
jgi:two-component system, cell cycle sensor histidine kinase and response regulator CckA